MKKIDFPILLTARSGLGHFKPYSAQFGSFTKKRSQSGWSVFIRSEKYKDNKRDIQSWGKVPVLLEIPLLSQITKSSLLEIFRSLNQTDILFYTNPV